MIRKQTVKSLTLNATATASISVTLHTFSALLQTQQGFPFIENVSLEIHFPIPPSRVFVERLR